MKYLILFGCAVALFIGSFATVYRIGITSADRLKAGAIVCSNAPAMEEAMRAAGDAIWLASIRECKVTDERHQARVLSCGWRTCAVRFWDEYGHDYVAFTRAKDLSH